jgi:protein-ribulosamine 3-kinase
MTPDEVLPDISRAIGEIQASAITPVLGGSINRSYVITARSGTRYFLKINVASAREMFEAENEGLAELKAAAAVRVPETIACGATAGTAFLLMEFLDLGGRADAAGTRLGHQLATQHAKTANAFGWHRNNTIGSTPQRNKWDEDWIGFFGRQRLRYQLDLACETNAAKLRDRGDRLVEKLPQFFDGYRPEPSLLHGDLWGGNWGVTQEGKPVIFDPAVYYGDREADLAMTHLFGGFGPEFYAAYDSAWPLDAGFKIRRDLYNLYHVLNHLNLFDGSYLQQGADLLDRLLAQ